MPRAIDARRVDEDVEASEGGRGRLRSRARRRPASACLEVELDERAAPAERLDRRLASRPGRACRCGRCRSPPRASAMAAVRPMPRVVPVTQATWPSRRKRSRTPGIGRGYHRAPWRSSARARDLARAGARRRRPHGRRFRSALLVLSDDAPPAYAFPSADIERRRAARTRPGARPTAPGYVAARPGARRGLPRGGRARARAIRAAPTTASTPSPARATYA